MHVKMFNIPSHYATKCPPAPPVTTFKGTIINVPTSLWEDKCPRLITSDHVIPGFMGRKFLVSFGLFYSFC